MNIRITSRIAQLLIAFVVLLNCRSAEAGSTFSWQGVLASGGAKVNDSADIQFRLFDSASGGVQIGPMLESLAYDVLDGQITVDLDFGPGAFPGNDRWLQVSVRVPSGGGPYEALSPRQPVMPTPYAMRAESVAQVPNAALAGTYTGAVSLTNGSNLFAGSGAGLTGLNASQVSSGSLNAARLPSAGNWNVGTQFTMDNDTFVIDAANNRIGIGTAAPTRALDVVGSIGASGPGASVVVRNPNNFDASYSLSWLNDVGRIRIGGNGPGASNGFDIQTINDRSILRVTTGGNVGFGTEDPLTNLHVQSAASAILRLEADTNNSGEADQPRVELSQDGGLITGSIGFHNSSNNMELLVEDTGAAVVDLLLRPEGNVGIGTIAPTEKLHVAGNTRIDGTLNVIHPAGDGSVVLPNGSISAMETAHEPGLGSVVSSGSTSLNAFPSPPTVIASRTISCPANGFVVILATVKLHVPPLQVYNSVTVAVSTATDGFTDVNSQLWRIESPPSGSIDVYLPPHTFTAVYPVSAGNQTFHLIGTRGGGGLVSADDTHFIVMYFSTAYGIVQTEH